MLSVKWNVRGDSHEEPQTSPILTPLEGLLGDSSYSDLIRGIRRNRADPAGALAAARHQPTRCGPWEAWYDVLPTILALKDIPVGKDMRGHVLADVVDAERLKKYPVRTIPTHDDKAFEAARVLRMKEAADQSERLEQLKSLGYIQ